MKRDISIGSNKNDNGMTMTGHKTRAVFERYNIVSEGDLQMAARKLDGAALKAQRTTDVVNQG